LMLRHDVTACIRAAKAAPAVDQGIVQTRASQSRLCQGCRYSCVRTPLVIYALTKHPNNQASQADCVLTYE
jgi:hypothetical protein